MPDPTENAPDDVDLDLVVPVYNEAAELEGSVRRIAAYLSAQRRLTWRITIADNASTDGTDRIARALADELPAVRALVLPRKGRGFALAEAWGSSTARVLAYVDVDLSTDLSALPPLIAPLLSGHSDLAIGTRLSRSSRVARGPKRELISRCYNLLLRGAMSAGFSDAQCGFKAIRRDVAERLLPLVEDGGWFFDTELLLLAERAGLRIHEVPVDWIDDPDSRVDIVATALADLRGMARVGVALARRDLPLAAIAAELGRGPVVASERPGFLGQLLRFGLVGGLSTVAFALLYLALQPLLGAQAADFVALLVTTIANTAANRWFTFGVRGRQRAVAHHIQGLLVFGLAWGITAGSLALLHAQGPVGAGPEIVVLTVANLVATVLRFLLLRGWVFRAPARPSSRRAAAARSLDTKVLSR